MAPFVDGRTQARAVRLQQERAALRVALEARESASRRRLSAPVEALQGRARMLESAKARLEDEVASLERGVRRQEGAAMRAVRFAGGVGEVLTAGLLLLSWLAGGWLICVQAAFPPALAVAFTGAPLVAMASGIRRTRR
ncbi:MAG: hypothetical protein AB1938_30595 [Myxococcota bacterium]